MSFDSCFLIGDRRVGLGQPAYLIAEIGRNHNGDLGLGKDSIDAAAAAGADCAKFQSFRAKELLIRQLPGVTHVQETGRGKTIYEMTEEVELSRDMHLAFRDHAAARGVAFLSTPEDLGMVALLDALGVPAFKVASLDIVYPELVEAVAATGKPLILSTGMAWLGEVEDALRLVERHGVRQVVLLHCTSNYPPRVEDVNLRAMETLHRAFGVPVGYSDHTFGIHVSVAAAALGACVIERHFTLDKALPGPDHRISLTGAEFAEMARQIRDVEKALGSPVKRPVAAEEEMRRLHRRRLVAARDLPAGHVLGRGDIGVKCSADGLEPRLLPETLGRRLRRAVAMDTALVAELLE